MQQAVAFLIFMKLKKITTFQRNFYALTKCTSGSSNALHCTLCNENYLENLPLSCLDMVDVLGIRLSKTVDSTFHNASDTSFVHYLL